MEANSTISAWPIVIGGLVIIGVAGYCVYQYMQKKTEHKGGCCKKDSVTKDISPELKRIVKYFSGNMNALRDVSIKPDLSLAKVTFDNIQQIIDVQGSSEIKKWYNAFGKDRNTWGVVLYKDKAKEIMKDDNYIIITKVNYPNNSNLVKERIYIDFSKRYNKLSQIQSGQECKIVAPYWIYNGEIFEKGLVTVK